MKSQVDLYDSQYGNFEAETIARVRRKTYGEDFGQNSWTTVDEYRSWAKLMELDESSHVLEVASGSGGPAVFLSEIAGCRVTGIDINELGIAAGAELARAHGVADRVEFRPVDADTRLSFDDNTFDAVICNDSFNHLPHRFEVLMEWRRVLKPGGRALFTDPVVVTGIVSNEELALRSSVGFFLFASPGVNEQLIADAGLELVKKDDVTENTASIAGRWHAARADDRDALTKIEGEERYRGLQDFFAVVHKLAAERRLSRIAYLVRKPVTM